MLGAQHGVQLIGEEPPRATTDDRLAIRAWNLLQNGHGAIDWAGLPVVAELLGITDDEGLLQRLEVIAQYEPPKD